MICFVGQLDQSFRSLTPHRSTQRLHESGEAGCFICTLNWKRIQRAAHRLARDPLKISGELKCVLAASRESNLFQANELLLKFEGKVISFYPFGWFHTAVTAVPAALVHKANLNLPEFSKCLATDEVLHKSSLSRSTHRLVREWLETCQTRHTHRNQRYRPSRAPVTKSLVEQWLQRCREDMATCNRWTGSPSRLPICGLPQK